MVNQLFLTRPLTDPSQLNISHSSSTINTPPPIFHETSRLTSFLPSFSPLPPNRTRIRKFSRVFHGRPRRKWWRCEGIQGGERRNRYPGRGWVRIGAVIEARCRRDKLETRTNPKPSLINQNSSRRWLGTRRREKEGGARNLNQREEKDGKS